jgi:ubiquitin-conjugating enzyme (huntingtin interacting protein 2)
VQWGQSLTSTSQGAICLDTLGPGWSPVQTIKSCLLCLRLLLENPNPKDPQDAEVAKLLNDNPAEFARTAHEWAVKYAGAPRRELDMSKYQKSAAVETRKPEENEYVRPVPGTARLVADDMTAIWATTGI